MSRIGGFALASTMLVALCFADSGAASALQTMTTNRSSPPSTASVEKLMAAGEAALRQNQLEEAERDFKSAIAASPQLAPAYANLGVIYMRRQQWDAALKNLEKAAKLQPKEPGIRLNIGLAYFKQNDFRHAVAPLESVIKDRPDNLQARYLLGLCYFYTERWVEATDELQTLWESQANNTAYLYVLSLAAEHAERKELSDRAAARLIHIGGDTPEFHLIVGKAKLNEEAYDDAVQELSAAAQGNSNLPLVHYYLGSAYAKKGNYAAARDEFLKGTTLEPDVPFDFEELGNADFQLHDDADAERAFRRALALDRSLTSSYIGLAKLYTRQGQNEKALAALDEAAKLDPHSSNIPYMRGQVLLKLGRTEEGRRELERSVAMSNEKREKRRQELEGPTSSGDASPQK